MYRLRQYDNHQLIKFCFFLHFHSEQRSLEIQILGVETQEDPVKANTSEIARQHPLELSDISGPRFYELNQPDASIGRFDHPGTVTRCEIQTRGLKQLSKSYPRAAI